MAGYFKHRGLDNKQIHGLLKKLNKQACSPRLEEDELESISYGCSKYESSFEHKTSCLYDEEEKDPEFVIKPYICVGEPNMLEGDPGCGKSTLLGEIAASVTTGKAFCGITPQRTGNVLFFAIEDNPNSVFKTRARLQGADQKKIYFVNDYLSLDEEGFNYLEDALSKKRFELVIIDTFTSVLGNRRVNDNGDMAQLVKRIRNVARQHDTAIILVRHLRKASTDNASYAGSGAVSIMGGARSSLIMKRCPENKDLRYLAQNKCNGVKEGQTLSFQITDAPDTEIGQLVWKGKSDLSADELLMLKPQKENERERAKLFLQKILSKKPLTSKVLEDEALENDISKMTLKRAKTDVGAKSFKKGKKWFWRLP